MTVVLLLFLLCTSAAETEKRIVKDFSLQNVDGKIISTKDYKDAKGFVVIFTCIHCPFAKLYHERLNQLHAKYSKLHIPLLLINSSDTIMFANESLANMAKVAKEMKYSFPYLFDPSQTVAKDFKAEKTPHAFVIWKENKQWIIKYSGAIDDNGAHPELVKSTYIANALDELLAGKPVTVSCGYSIGCAIHYRK
ncbi:MAG: thioredoxin family protein [Bacteroidetes bacterium]|nr:thioredoxin family protein [Bacteroidota bacterium]